jgi:hypothetical protein
VRLEESERPNNDIGWLTVFAWMFEVAAVQTVLANQVTALIIFNNDSYEHKGWHTTLLIWLFIALPLLPNLFFRKLLNVFEIFSGICCVLFFFVNIILLAALAQKSDNAFVFKTLIHESPGWTNPGLAWCVGFLSPVSALIGESLQWLMITTDNHNYCRHGWCNSYECV